MVREIDLIHYLPLFIAEYKEIQHVMNTENPEFQLIADESEVIKNNQYIITCNEAGIAKFEKLLGIIPGEEDTLELRISRVLIKWNDVIPYTWKVFLKKMASLCGAGNFEVIPNWNEYFLKIITHLDLYGQMDELENILAYMLPANIAVDVKNELSYSITGNLFVVAGIAVCEIFQLTDSFQVTWSFNADAGVAASGAGTCEIMITDSFKDTIQLGYASNVGSTVSFTEII